MVGARFVQAFEFRGMHSPRPPQTSQVAIIRLWLLAVVALMCADTAGGRGDAADRIGPLDHRVEAGHRHRPAVSRRNGRLSSSGTKQIPQYRELNQT